VLLLSLVYNLGAGPVGCSVQVLRLQRMAKKADQCSCRRAAVAGEVPRVGCSCAMGWL
jgi:hypothetical protein